jgi:hypothetical protein
VTSKKGSSEVRSELEALFQTTSGAVDEAYNPAPMTYRPDYREQRSQSSLHMGC